MPQFSNISVFTWNIWTGGGITFIRLDKYLDINILKNIMVLTRDGKKLSISKDLCKRAFLWLVYTFIALFLVFARSKQI